MISIFDLFSIGIGPSSSHTVAPMKAANKFTRELQAHVKKTARVRAELFGSLAYTGKGHSTDRAIIAGLEGHLPDQVEPQNIRRNFERVVQQSRLKLCGEKIIAFDITQDLIFNLTKLLPQHSNGMCFTAYDERQQILSQKTYYSIGGGFIVSDVEEMPAKEHEGIPPYLFKNCQTLTDICRRRQIGIDAVMMENEKTWADEKTVRHKILDIYGVMKQCIDNGLGCQEEALLPGQLRVKRRAPAIYKKLRAHGIPETYEQRASLDWINAFALAVNEENAAGSRVVTAPTNGAAGIIPAVLEYYMRFYPQAREDDIVTFLLTAAAIAILYKKGASISAAEVGCQGEVGVACSMAAGAFTAILGGSLTQIINAAEMAMAHHLGLTCDPVGGLVQIPCIERNAVGAATAVNVARLALLEEAPNRVTLDEVIATMKQTGEDMNRKYKETSTGGLAVNVPVC